MIAKFVHWLNSESDTIRELNCRPRIPRISALLQAAVDSESLHIEKLKVRSL